jgi:glycyl-tRNA synthetase beta chain
MNQTLLVELQTEELPPKALVKLGAAFANGIANGLKARDFLDADSVVTTYATPRRLAVAITNVRATSPDKAIREKVLPVRWPWTRTASRPRRWPRSWPRWASPT